MFFDYYFFPSHRFVPLKYNVSLRELPKIKKDDSAISSLNVKVGDVIKIARASPTAGETVFYRGVISE